MSRIGSYCGDTDGRRLAQLNRPSATARASAIYSHGIAQPTRFTDESEASFARPLSPPDWRCARSASQVRAVFRLLRGEGIRARCVAVHDTTFLERRIPGRTSVR